MTTTAQPTGPNRTPLLSIYCLVVSFCCLMCLVIALGVCLYDGVRAIWPQFTISSVAAWQSDAQVIAYYPDKKEADQAELQRLKAELRSLALQEERRSGAQGLVFWGIIVAIDAVVYALHWRIARAAPGNCAPA